MIMYFFYVPTLTECLNLYFNNKKGGPALASVLSG